MSKRGIFSRDGKLCLFLFEKITNKASHSHSSPHCWVMPHLGCFHVWWESWDSPHTLPSGQGFLSKRRTVAPRAAPASSSAQRQHTSPLNVCSAMLPGLWWLHETHPGPLKTGEVRFKILIVSERKCGMLQDRLEEIDCVKNFQALAQISIILLAMGANFPQILLLRMGERVQCHVSGLHRDPHGMVGEGCLTDIPGACECHCSVISIPRVSTTWCCMEKRTSTLPAPLILCLWWQMQGWILKWMGGIPVAKYLNEKKNFFKKRKRSSERIRLIPLLQHRNWHQSLPSPWEISRTSRSFCQ